MLPVGKDELGDVLGTKWECRCGQTHPIEEGEQSALQFVWCGHDLCIVGVHGRRLVPPKRAKEQE